MQNDHLNNFWTGEKIRCSFAVPVPPEVVLRASCYTYFLGSYNICNIYLHVIEACFKVIIVMFNFFHLGNLGNIMKNALNSISIYFWKKMALLTNIRKKRLLTSWKMAKILSSIVSHFQHDYRLLFSTEMGNIRTCKKVRLQELMRFRLSG